MAEVKNNNNLEKEYAAKQFKLDCEMFNDKLLAMQSDELKEIVPARTAFMAIVIVKNMAINDIGDAFLFASALNVLNTFVKQDKESKKTVGYFFKGSAEKVMKFLTTIDNPLIRVEMQKDQGMSLMVTEIAGIQFSFHQVQMTQETLKFKAKDYDHPDIPWDGIRKQRCANTLFEFAYNNQYGRTNKMIDGSDFNEGLKEQLELFDNGEKTLVDAKRAVYINRDSNIDDAEHEHKSVVGKGNSYPFRNMPSATLFEGEFSQFAEAVANREIDELLKITYEDGYGQIVSPIMLLNWRYSLFCMYQVLSSFNIPDDIGVRIENERGRYQEHLQFILLSKKEDRKIFLGIIEILPWNQMSLTKDRDMVTYIDIESNEKIRAIHPAYSVNSFSTYLLKGIKDRERFLVRPCVFFYDAIKKEDTDIYTNYKKIRHNACPVFYAGEEELLHDYIKDVLNHGEGHGAIDSIRHLAREKSDVDVFMDDQKYAINKLMKYLSMKEKFIYLVDGRTGTGKTSVLNAIEDAVKNRKMNLYRVNTDNFNTSVPDDVEVILYDDVIPDEIDYDKHPYIIMFFDIYTKTIEEQDRIVDYKIDSCLKHVNVYSFSLTSALGFSDFGGGNNWLIRHLQLADVGLQEWDSKTYSIRIIDNLEDYAKSEDIALVKISADITYDENTKTIVATRDQQIKIYRAISEGFKGVDLYIENEKLKDHVSYELNSDLNKYQWVTKYINSGSGDENAMLEAQKDILNNDVVHNRFESLAKESIGESSWNKLQPMSQNCIISALIGFNDMRHIDSKLDFSGVTIQLSKVVEIESRYRLFTKYIEYVKEKYGSEYLEHLSYPLVEVDSNGNKTYAGDNAYTLGAASFITGLDMKFDIENQTAYDTFMEYAAKELFANTEDVLQNTKDMINFIEYVRVNYRNKSAHANSIDLITAKKCIDYLVSKKRMIGTFVDMMKY